jgi:hypothetical protein
MRFLKQSHLMDGALAVTVNIEFAELLQAFRQFG